ncbi:hypothetical protein VNO77_41407 [Canavalia gladiata]|uniref:Uncharacterized protein n=1 Tax=Canavalia gladiata TaxID=3824 RepID=A0AAN9PSJ1_CANGL
MACGSHGLGGARRLGRNIHDGSWLTWLGRGLGRFGGSHGLVQSAHNWVTACSLKKREIGLWRVRTHTPRDCGSSATPLDQTSGWVFYSNTLALYLPSKIDL